MASKIAAGATGKVKKEYKKKRDNHGFLVDVVRLLHDTKADKDGTDLKVSKVCALSMAQLVDAMIHNVMETAADMSKVSKMGTVRLEDVRAALRILFNDCTPPIWSKMIPDQITVSKKSKVGKKEKKKSYCCC